jgi:RimJ/RimL family protein N-acetyltransferase
MGKGLATRATRLAAIWALQTGGVEEVELRIDLAHRASQRVAEKAGFRAAGTVTSHVERTGETFEDYRCVLTSACLGGHAASA